MIKTPEKIAQKDENDLSFIDQLASGEKSKSTPSDPEVQAQDLLSSMFKDILSGGDSGKKSEPHAKDKVASDPKVLEAQE